MTRVLLADDSATMRTIIKRSLNALGITQITEAEDGCKALAAFKPDMFDLILTDWNMPNKNGLELARDIRAQGCTLPIMMITTEAEKHRVVEAVQAGVSDYVIKPFTPEILRTKLERFAVIA